MSAETVPSDSRTQPRMKLPAMYTVLRAKPLQDKSYCWTGHIYDLSVSGMRFELDNAVQPGTAVCVRATLPGTRHVTIQAQGRIVRIHDDEPGPSRMAMAFEFFPVATDRQKLERYLDRRTQSTDRAASRAA